MLPFVTDDRRSRAGADFSWRDSGQCHRPIGGRSGVGGGESGQSGHRTDLCHADVERGEFAFADLPLGDYSISIAQDGFESLKINDVRVSAGSIYNLPVKLSVARVSSSVEVSAAAISLETTTPAQTNVVPTSTVQDLPVNGRNFTQLIALAPGFAGYGGAARSTDRDRAR